MKWFVLVFLLSLLVLLSVPAHAADYVCDSCSNCTSTIQSALSGDAVRLTTNIAAGSAACINISDVSGVTFDCQDYVIDGGGSYNFGVWLESNNNVVRNCRIQNFQYGLFVMGNDSLIENVVSSGNSWAGIDILGLSTGSTIRNSVFNSNTGQTGYGILLTGNVTYNVFVNVTSGSNSRGISVQSSSNSNTFTDMTVDGNTEYGIEINESDSNVLNDSFIQNNPIGISLGDLTDSNQIYNNYFDNTGPGQMNSRVYPNSGVNDWNVTKTPGTNIIGDNYLGGNFWDDYTGTDSDGDGLGDTPYSMGASNFDYLPLLHPPFVISLVPPTPANQSVLTRSWVFVNASANKALDECLLEWNGTNESATVSGRICYVNKTGLSDGDYWFRIWGNDTYGNATGTGMRVVTVNSTIQDTAAPSIHASIQPTVVVNGSNVSLMINASDPSGVDTTWIIVTLPDSSTQTIYVANGATVNYTTSLLGRYDVNFFANDTLGNQANVSSYFSAQISLNQTNFTVNVLNNTGGGIDFNLTVYQVGTSNVTAQYQGSSGTLTGQLVEGTYDFDFDSYSGNLKVLLRGISLSQNTDKTIRLDVPYPAYGFAYTYAVETDYSMSIARVRMKYLESSFTNESFLGFYICDDWNFTARSCPSTWNLSTAAAQNATGNYFDIDVTGFSAFSIKQEPYCGDGVCASNENSTYCSLDCECDPGTTRPCNVTYQGWCGKGTETCIDGSWTGCPVPGTETCNREDDDCDGVIDNVGGGTSVETTQCGCYNGANPGNEVCNGIDDDCDGEADEGGDCCINGQTRSCGPSNETGACRMGTATCANNVWGQCENATYAVAEICGNGEDDDCDGETDEGCFWDFGLILIILGVIILVVIIILYLHFRKQGKELTWEELKNKWTPAHPSQVKNLNNA